jgi:hypothetical protein
VTFIFFMMALKIKGILTKLIDSLNLAIFTKLTPPLHPYIASQIRVGAFPSLSLTSNGSPFLRFLRTMDKIRCLCHTSPPRFPTPRLGTSSRRRARHAVRCRARGGGVREKNVVGCSTSCRSALACSAAPALHRVPATASDTPSPTAPTHYY